MSKRKSPRHCHQCGRRLGRKKEENRHRHYCGECGLYIYENPLPVVGIICLNPKKELLLIRRAQNPGRGKWAFPSGFLELRESPEKGALRELREETGVRGEIVQLLGVYARNEPMYKSLLTVFYLAKHVSGKLRKTRETLNQGFFPVSKLKAIGFKTHHRALRKYLELERKGQVDL